MTTTNHMKCLRKNLLNQRNRQIESERVFKCLLESKNYIFVLRYRGFGVLAMGTVAVDSRCRDMVWSVKIFIIISPL